MRIENLLPLFLTSGSSLNPEASKATTQSAASTPGQTSISSGVGVEGLLTSSLEELATAIHARSRLIEALPQAIKHLVHTLVTRDFQLNHIKESGFSTLAFALKYLQKDLAQLQQTLEQNPEELPLEIKQEWKTLTYSDREKVIEVLRELSVSFAKTEKAQDNLSQSTNSAAFFVPLTFDSESRTYPAYIHIYRDDEPEQNTLSLQREIWLRICLITENLGPIETVFRLHNQTLDIRVQGTNEVSSNLNIDRIRDSLNKLPYTIGGISVKSG